MFSPPYLSAFNGNRPGRIESKPLTAAPSVVVVNVTLYVNRTCGAWYILTCVHLLVNDWLSQCDRPINRQQELAGWWFTVCINSAHNMATGSIKSDPTNNSPQQRSQAQQWVLLVYTRRVVSPIWQPTGSNRIKSNRSSSSHLQYS